MAEKRESVVIELPEDEMLHLMLMAHEHDITFNQLVEGILKSTIERGANSEVQGD